MSDKVQMTSRTGSVGRILRFRRKLRELKLDAERGGSSFGAHWGETNLRAMGAALDRGQMKKHKILWSRPYVETFNSKLIKGFRTWTKKSLRLFEFRDSYVLYVYMLSKWVINIDVHFPNSHIMAQQQMLMATRLLHSLWELNPTGVGEYIYIYIYTNTHTLTQPHTHTDISFLNRQEYNLYIIRCDETTVEF